MEQVLEEEFARARFLRKIITSHSDAADLQFLNVGMAPQLELDMHKTRLLLKQQQQQQQQVESQHGTAMPTHSSSSSPSPNTAEHTSPVLVTNFTGSRTASIDDRDLDDGALDEKQGQGQVRSALRVTRFKSTRAVHSQWLDDQQAHIAHLCRQIHTLIWRPTVQTWQASKVAAAADAGVGPNSLADQNSPAGKKLSSINEKHSTKAKGNKSAALAAVATAAATAASERDSNMVRQTANKGKDKGDVEDAPEDAVPLPEGLVHKLLRHVERIRGITCKRREAGQGAREMQSTRAEFLSCLQELKTARGKILHVMGAMTWPMQKQLDWLKATYDRVLEENRAANEEVEGYSRVLEQYRRDAETFKDSIQQLEKECDSAAYRSTRVLSLANHDLQV